MPVNASFSGPYDAGAGANLTEDNWRKMARLWVPTGVVAGQLNELNPFGDSTGLQAKVDTGAAWVRGEYGEWTSGVSTQGLAAVGGIAGGSERWDRLIVRNDFVNNVMQLDVLTGAAGASPNAARPALTQSSSMWEFLLADVGPLVNTTTTVPAAMVLDLRWKLSPNGLLYREINPAGAANVDFTLIPQSYSSLLIVGQLKTNQAATQIVAATFNGDNTGPYEWGVSTLNINSNVTTTTGSSSDTKMLATYASVLVCGFSISIPGYAGATLPKTLLSQSHRFDGATTDLGPVTASGVWNPAAQAAITRVTLTPTVGTLTGKVILSPGP